VSRFGITCFQRLPRSADAGAVADTNWAKRRSKTKNKQKREKRYKLIMEQDLKFGENIKMGKMNLQK